MKYAISDKEAVTLYNTIVDRCRELENIVIETNPDIPKEVDEELYLLENLSLLILNILRSCDEEETGRMIIGYEEDSE